MNYKVSGFSVQKVENVSILQTLYSDRIKKVIDENQYSKTVKLKSGEVRIFRDCYEYYIDGKSLSNIIATKNELVYPQNHPDNKLKFLEFNSGTLGSFNSLANTIAIESLLLKNYSASEISELSSFQDHVKSFSLEDKNSLLTNIYNKLMSDIKWVYITVDGDHYGGGWSFKITKSNGFYVWNDLNTSNELVYQFEEDQYQSALNSIVLS